MYFLALSQAPPEFELEMAIWTPETITPARYPDTALGPKSPPRTKGVKMTIIPGKIISVKEAAVEISMQRVGSNLPAFFCWIISSH